MWWKIVWFFFPFIFSSVFLHFTAIFFFFVTVGFLFFLLFFFIKHLRSRTPTQYKQRPPIPTPGAPAGLGALGDPLAFCVAVFLVSGTGGQARGSGAVEFVQHFPGEMVTRRGT